jgi:hypothetical protein
MIHLGLLLLLRLAIFPRRPEQTVSRESEPRLGFLLFNVKRATGNAVSLASIKATGKAHQFSLALTHNAASLKSASQRRTSVQTARDNPCLKKPAFFTIL